MTLRSLLFVSVSLVCAFAWLCAVGQPPTVPTLQAGDTRLDRPISIHTAGIFMGDLCNYLSRATGARIVAAEEHSTADARMAIYADQITARDLMDAAASYCGTQGAEWAWHTAGTGNSATYTLVAPSKWQLYSEDLNTLARKQTAAAYSLEIAMSAMTQKQRAAHLPQLMAALGRLDMPVPPQATNPETWLDIATAANAFTPASIEHTILTGQAARLSASRIPERYKAMRTMVDERVGPPTPGVKVTGLSISSGPYQQGFYPAVSIQGEIGGDGVSGQAGRGFGIGMFWDTPQQLQVQTDWLVPGDSPHSALEQMDMAVPMQTISSFPGDPLSPYSYLAHSANIAVIAQPLGRIPIFVPPLSTHTLAAYMSELRNQGIRWKWRGKALMCRPVSWFAQGESPLTYGQFVRLHAAAASSMPTMDAGEIVALLCTIPDTDAPLLAPVGLLPNSFEYLRNIVRKCGMPAAKAVRKMLQPGGLVVGKAEA